MTNPTPGQDPYQQGQPPGYGSGPSYPNAPQSQSGFGGPAYPNAPQGYGTDPAKRPGTVTAAAVIGIVIGALGVLGGLLSLGVLFDFSAALGLLSLVSLVISIGMLVGGIQVLRGGSPQILLFAAYASIAINIIVIIYELASGYGFAGLGLISFVLPILIVVFIRQNQGWFASRGIK